MSEQRTGTMWDAIDVLEILDLQLWLVAAVAHDRNRVAAHREAGWHPARRSPTRARRRRVSNPLQDTILPHRREPEVTQ
jgi:hypothetical protein